MGCSTGGLGWGQPLWDMVLIPASSLQLIWTSAATAQSGAWRPPLLGAGSLYSILSPTNLNFLSLGLYNNLTPALLPANITISHSVQPLDSQGYILIFLDRMHLLFTQVHFLFWQLGQVGGQYATKVNKYLKLFQEERFSIAVLLFDQILGSWIAF